MLEQKERIIIWVAICISVIAVAGVAMLATMGRQSAEDIDIVHRRKYDYGRPQEHPPSKPFAEDIDEPVKTDVKLKTNHKLTIYEVIGAARTWQPVYTYWFGREAPDFTLTDIDGKQHKLSDYKGKNVMIILWATWCGPCLTEIPHLITLRDLISEDELAMLAISYRSAFMRETATKVRNFVKRNRINYTVFSTDASALPYPFSRISGIPTTFFIDKQGKIKLATEGTVSLGEIRAILEAE